MTIPTARTALLLPILMALALAPAGCSSSSSTTSPTTTAITDTFTGTVKQNGTTIHPFAVTTSGALTVTLTSVTPLSNLALGVGLGTWDGSTSTCSSAIATNANSRTGSAALTGTVLTGNFCVRVYDSGNIADGATISYTVEVVHP
jgi:hypothetical protein